MAETVPWLVAGRYEVGEIVGRGGSGTVRRALDRQTGQPVAMKLLSADAGKDPHWVERMLREQQALVAMAGTCAVSVVDLCQLASGAPCLIMEWLEGCDLEHQLSDWEAAGQRPSLELLLEIVRPLADTLQRAHELGIVHRDIKPANVFLTAGATDPSTAHGAVRLLDFGLSRMRSARPLTAVGMVMGSPSYIPPETWRGNSALIDHRADLYSLAVIIYRMLAGRLPFETPSLLDKLQLVTTAERPSVCALRAELPASVDDWMKRALAIEPDQRFQSGRAFYDALALALSGAPSKVTDDEVSGVREKASANASAGSGLHAEHRNALSVAWQRATSLLHRFIGPKGAPQATPAVGTPETSQAADELAPPGLSRAADELPPPECPAPPIDGTPEAWLDDGDVEDAPPESALATEPRANSRRGKRRGRRTTASPPNHKPKQPKKPKAARPNAKKARPKKPKAARKKR